VLAHAFALIDREGPITPGATIVSISVTTGLTDTVYAVNEPFSTAGLVVTRRDKAHHKNRLYPDLERSCRPIRDSLWAAYSTDGGPRTYDRDMDLNTWSRHP
jgi:hypothetical protein